MDRETTGKKSVRFTLTLLESDDLAFPFDPLAPVLSFPSEMSAATEPTHAYSVTASPADSFTSRAVCDMSCA